MTLLMKLRRGIAVGACALALSGCAAAPNRDDPFEPFNRAMYQVKRRGGNCVCVDRGTGSGFYFLEG